MVFEIMWNFSKSKDEKKNQNISFYTSNDTDIFRNPIEIETKKNKELSFTALCNGFSLQTFF